MRASILLVAVAALFAGNGCNVFIPDWGTQGKACRSDADCNGITCDPFAVCANSVLLADESNGGHQTLPNPCGADVELALSEDGEWAYLLIACTKAPSRSSAWQIGRALDGSRNVVIQVASRDSPWNSTDCIGVGPLLPFPDHHGMLAGCRVGKGDRVRLYERSSNDWRLVMDPWQDLQPKILALSEEFSSNNGEMSRYIAAIDRNEQLQLYNFSTNTPVLQGPKSPGITVKSMAFPADRYRLALGGCLGNPSTSLKLATITNDDATFSDIATDLACVDELAYSVGGNWLFGLVRESSTPTEPKLFAWKVANPYETPKTADCFFCKHMAVAKDGDDNIMVMTRLETGPQNQTQLMEFVLADDAEPTATLTFRVLNTDTLAGEPAALATATVGPNDAVTPILVLATDRDVHLWNLKRLRIQ